MGKKLGEDGLNALISLVKGQTVEEFSLAEISSLWNGATYSTQTVETYTVYEGYSLSEYIQSDTHTFSNTELVAEKCEGYKVGTHTSDANKTISLVGSTTNYGMYQNGTFAHTGIISVSQSGLTPTLETYEYSTTSRGNVIPLETVETVISLRNNTMFTTADEVRIIENVGITTISSGNYATSQDYDAEDTSPYRYSDYYTEGTHSFTNWYSVSYSVSYSGYTIELSQRASCTTTDPSALYYIVSSTTSTR